MAACGSLEHIFEKPLPDNQTLLESLSPWKQLKSKKAIEDSSVTEIFGELHFKETTPPEPTFSSPPSSQSSPSSSLSSISTISNDVNIPHLGIDIPKNGFHQDKNRGSMPSYYRPLCDKNQYRHSDSFSSMNSESLSLCTEGLGFESFDDVEDLLRNDSNNENQHNQEERRSFTRQQHNRSRTSRGEFPPPISCIGRSGKPWVCFKSYREDGRFILKEIRIPTQEFMHACRENGRLKLQFIHSESDDEIFPEDEAEEEPEENIYEKNEIGCNKDDLDGIHEFSSIGVEDNMSRTASN